MENAKEVYFDVYCQHCKYYGLDAEYDPCNECLGIGAREGSHRPEYFEENHNPGGSKQCLK